MHRKEENERLIYYSRMQSNESQPGQIVSEPLLENNGSQLNINQLLFPEIIMTNQRVVRFATTNMIISPNRVRSNVQHPVNVTARQLARRRRRQRQRQRRRERRQQLAIEQGRQQQLAIEQRRQQQQAMEQRRRQQQAIEQRRRQRWQERRIQLQQQRREREEQRLIELQEAEALRDPRPYTQYRAFRDVSLHDDDGENDEDGATLFEVKEFLVEVYYFEKMTLQEQLEQKQLQDYEHSLIEDTLILIDHVIESTQPFTLANDCIEQL